MEMKLEQGDFVIGATGLPEIVEGLEELLQAARLRIAMRQGSLPYDRALGSCFFQWTPEGSHAAQRALALANEALLELPGVRAVGMEITGLGCVFTLETPLGTGQAEVSPLGEGNGGLPAAGAAETDLLLRKERFAPEAEQGDGYGEL